MAESDTPDRIEADGSMVFGYYDPEKSEVVDKPLFVVNHVKLGWTIVEGASEPVMAMQLQGPGGELAVGLGFPEGMVGGLVELIINHLDTLDEMIKQDVEAEVLPEEDD